MRYITLGSEGWGGTRLIAVACFLLAGCGGGVNSASDLPKRQPEVRIETAPVLVATGCIAKEGRPEQPAPLNKKIKPEDWAVLAPGAKAEAVRAQAGERLNYEDADRAATAGCK